MRQRAERRHDIRIAEGTVQLRREEIRTERDSLAVRTIRRDEQRHLLHEHRVQRRSEEKRIQHHVSRHVIRTLAIQIHGKGKRRTETRLRERLGIKMTAEQIEINLRIPLPKVHYAVKRQRQMRVIDSELTLVSPRLQFTVYMQVVIGVVIIRELTHMGFHIAVEGTFVNPSFGRQIERHRLQRRHIQHLPEAEILTYHAGVISQVFESRIRAEGTVGRDHTQGSAESTVEREVM